MQQRSPGVRGLVFGGIMAAMVVVFALVPLLSLFLPIPLVLAYVRYGGRVAGLTAAVAIVFCALFVGPVQAFVLMVPAGVLPGLAFGYGFRRKLSPLIIGLIVVTVFFVGFAANYAVMRVAMFHGRDPFAATLEQPQMRQLVDQFFDAGEQLLKAQPASTEAQQRNLELSLGQMNEFRQNPLEAMWALLPASLFFLGAVSTWINYMLCRWILPRFGHAVPAPTPFREFRLPVWLIWVYMLAMFGAQYVGSSLLNAPWWVKLVMNVIGPLAYIFLLVGMAVAYGFLRKKEVPKPAAILFTLLGLVLLRGLGMQLYTMLAMLDTVFDFRGLGHGTLKRPEETP